MIDFIAKLVGKDADTLYREWHSLETGWAEMICFRIPPLVSITKHMLNEMTSEWHYYAVGRASGVITWIVIIAIMKGVLF